MLPPAARLTTSREFGLVVRRGRRAGRSRLVLHVLLPDEVAAGAASASGRHAQCPDERGTAREVKTAPTWQARVGFVVSKAVGNAVVRHRVARRLRHLMRSRLERLPAGTLVVVRALPRAATARSAELGADLDAATRKLGVLDADSVPDETRAHRDEDRELHGRSG